jgi:hypothetical protein
MPVTLNSVAYRPPTEQSITVQPNEGLFNQHEVNFIIESFNDGKMSVRSLKARSTVTLTPPAWRSACGGAEFIILRFQWRNDRQRKSASPGTNPVNLR